MNHGSWMRMITLVFPFNFTAIWKVVKQWMSEEQRSKVFFCSRQELSKFIEKDQLPVAMNGTVSKNYFISAVQNSA